MLNFVACADTYETVGSELKDRVYENQTVQYEIVSPNCAKPNLSQGSPPQIVGLTSDEPLREHKTSYYNNNNVVSNGQLNERLKSNNLEPNVQLYDIINSSRLMDNNYEQLKTERGSHPNHSYMTIGNS